MIDSESTLDQSLAGLCDVTRPHSELGLRIKGACRTERAGRRLSRRKRFVSTVLVLAAGGLLFLTMLRQMQHVAQEGWLRLGLGAAAGWAIAPSALAASQRN